MHRIPVHTIMTSPTITINPEALTADAATLMEENNIRRLPVVDEDGCLLGIVTDSDILEAETAETVLSSYEPGIEEEWLEVKDVMTRDTITIGPDYTVGELAIRFMENKVGGVPVVEPLGPDKTEPCPMKVIGIVTETDIFRLIAEAWRSEQP